VQPAFIAAGDLTDLNSSLEDSRTSSPDPGSHFFDIQDEEAAELDSGDADMLDLNEEDLLLSSLPSDLASHSAIPHIRLNQQFIKLLQAATLSDSGLSDEGMKRLRSPPQQTLQAQLQDADLKYSIMTYFKTSRGCRKTYRSAREAALERHPKDNFLSFDQIKTRIEELTGVYAVKHSMCLNSCLAFTGPFKDDTHCSICGEERYLYINSKRTSRQQFYTLLLGPQLQAYWSSPKGADSMEYLLREILRLRAHRDQDGKIIVNDYNDFCCGSDFLENENIRLGDTILLLSMDGCQLYRSKQSDCWIYIWVILSLPPHLRYKKSYVIPGGVIPGPNPPKIHESYLFPGLYHLSALQKEGLRCWNAKTGEIFTDRPYLAMATADRMGMVHLDGSVGHSGAYGCQVSCGMRGRHQPGKPQYFPVLLKPDDYTVHGCDHGDIDPRTLAMGGSDEYQRKIAWLQAASNAREFARHRFASGLVKPTILSGLPRSLGAPALFGIDLMHLTTLNLASLILDMFRGTITCATSDNQNNWAWATLNGDRWTQHGSLVASTRPYLPGCFDRAPRNPAEKINSGYKSSEFLIYIFVLGPAVFRPWLPTDYWQHFCKLVAGVRRFFQTTISHKDLEETYQQMIEYVIEFELLYVQRRADRIHFVRPCLHGLIHIAELIIRKGPLPGFSQYVMERTIGNLGEEIKQDSRAYANLSERALFRC
jgi:hypothetical protein